MLLKYYNIQRSLTWWILISGFWLKLTQFLIGRKIYFNYTTKLNNYRNGTEDMFLAFSLFLLWEINYTDWKVCWQVERILNILFRFHEENFIPRTGKSISAFQCVAKSEPILHFIRPRVSLYALLWKRYRQDHQWHTNFAICS